MNAPETIDQPGSAVAIREEYAERQASPALFGTSDPVEVVANAVRVADALKAVVVSKKLVANIQGKEYPQVEAWLTLAAMLRLTTICEWSRPVDDGWEARVIVRDANGNTVGAAEAQCLKSERSKRTWDYALRSMSQTRATSKSLRSVLGFIMVLAGYEATPMEEMPGNDAPPPKRAEPAPNAAPVGRTLAQQKAFLAWLTHVRREDSPQAEVDFRLWARGLTPQQVHERIAAERAEMAASVRQEPATSAEPPAPASAPSGDLKAAHEAVARVKARQNGTAAEPEAWSMSDEQRALLMVHHTEAGHILSGMSAATNDAVRHAWYAKSFRGPDGKPLRSSKKMTRAQYDEALRLLSAEIDARNAREPEQEALL